MTREPRRETPAEPGHETPAEPGHESRAEPLLTGRALGRALFRAVLAAALIAPGLAFLASQTFARHVPAAALLGIFAVPSLTAGALLLVELGAQRRPATLRRDLATGLVAWLGATVGLLLGLLQFLFLEALSTKQRALTLDEAGGIVAAALHDLKPALALIFVAITACAAPTTIARVRGLDRGACLLLVPFANALLGGPVGLLVCAIWQLPRRDVGAVIMLVGVPAVVLPLASRLADLVEARVFTGDGSA